jgi:hypothetical protein
MEILALYVLLKYAELHPLPGLLGLKQSYNCIATSDNGAALTYTVTCTHRDNMFIENLCGVSTCAVRQRNTGQVSHVVFKGTVS